MGNRKFRGTKKPERRKSKTHGTGTGDVTGLIQVQLDSRTTIFCKTEADVVIAQRKWELRKEKEMKYLQVKNYSVPSRSKEYEKKALEEKNAENKRKRELIGNKSF